MIYVNEIDPYCAQWLQNLMDAGVLPAGHIDTRSIEDVTPNDLAGYTQCHFFAGLGGWIYALDLAGWPRDRPVWTGSCPCQPFSAAGKGAGFADERHLWPAWQHLIAQRKPATVFGEQVASKAVDDWIDLVHADMEGLGYAFGVVAFPAASVGAPHIRDRAYWVADATRQRCGETRVEHRGRSAQRPGDGREPVGLAHSLPTGRPEGWSEPGHRSITGSGEHGGVVYPVSAGLEGYAGHGDNRDEPGRLDAQSTGSTAAASGACRLADAAESRHAQAGEHERGSPPLSARSAEHGGMVRPTGPLHSFWSDADWLLCRDGKFRPVEPGTFPLAHGIPGRVGRLRAYGNAINPHQAAEFVAAFMSIHDVQRELAAAERRA